MSMDLRLRDKTALTDFRVEWRISRRLIDALSGVVSFSHEMIKRAAPVTAFLSSSVGFGVVCSPVMREKRKPFATESMEEAARLATSRAENAGMLVVE